MDEICLWFVRPFDLSCCAWIFFVFVQIAVTKGPPHIVSRSETRHLMGAGETLRLTCFVEAVPPAIITWQKDGDMIHPGWDRYRTNENSHALKIKDLETTDSGVFTCHATNGFGSVRAKYLVYVYDVNATSLPPEDFDEDIFETLPGREDPPKFSNVNQMKSVVRHHVGDTVRLACNSSGIPRPEVTWYKNGVVLRQTAEVNERWTLKIPNARTGDSGTYLCKVKNKAGSIEFTFSVHVTDRTLQDGGAITRPPMNTSAAVGTEAAFDCHIRSDAQPHVQWLKRLSSAEELPRKRQNDTVNLDGQRYLVLQEAALTNPHPGTFVSRLTVGPVSLQDAGMYVCSTITSEGLTNRTAFLSVTSSGSDDVTREVTLSSMFDDAFLPVIMAIVSVFALLFISVVVYVICVCRDKADDRSTSRNQPPPPQHRLTTTTTAAGGAVVVVANSHPLQHPETRMEHQYAVRSNAQGAGGGGGGHVTHAAHGLMGANSRELIARCHPNSYNDYSSIAKTPAPDVKQLLLLQQQQQQQQLQHYHQQTTPLSRDTQLHFYENC